jgi:DNA-binding response OmpR family regulator
MSNHPVVVLFADRDLLWSRSLRTALRQRGVKVLTGTTRREVIEIAAITPPDLVVLAQPLVGVDAADLLARIRTRNPQSMLALLGPNAEATPSLPGLLIWGPRPAESRSLLNSIAALFPDRLARTPSIESKPALVMCVDDDPLFLRSLSRLLYHHGYRVATFEDPELAVQALSEILPDLVILDVMMPGLNGLAVAEEVKGGFAGHIPVVMLTARSTDSAIIEAYRRGATYYITKPCEPRTVLNIVDYLVGDLDKEERRLLETRL